MKKLLLLFSLIFLSFNIQAEPIKLILHHFYAPSEPSHTDVLIPWAKRVNELTDGRENKNDFPIYENSFSVQFKDSIGINWSLSLVGFKILDIWIYREEESVSKIPEG